MDLTGISAFPDLELLPNILDRVATEDPTKVWISCPNEFNDLSKGFRDYTTRELANWVNNASWFLDKHLGKVREGKPPTVAYIGPSDIRYLLVPIALAKCGYESIPLSDLVSAEVRVFLCEEAGCNILVCAQGFGDNEVASRETMKRIIFPELDELFKPATAPQYLFEKNLEEALNDPFFILHTSGSSSPKGFPTMIRYPHGSCSLNGLLKHIPDHDGLPSLYNVMSKSSRTYTGFRITHAGGFFFAFRQIYMGVTVVVGGDDQGSMRAIERVIDYGRIDSAALVPNSLKEISESPRMLEKLSKLKWVISSGAMLPKQVGDTICKKVHLISVYGSTEAISTTYWILPTEDWEYIYNNPEFDNFQFEESGENLFEAVYYKHSDPALRLHQGVFWCLPDLDRWSMKDLFAPHPTRKNAWKYISRADELVIMENGYKLLPTPFEEEVLGKDPRIKIASVYGTAKEHLAVIIELVDPPPPSYFENKAKEMKSGTTVDASDPIVDEIWPVVQTVNDELTKFSTKTSQIPKHAVIIANPERSLPRTGKGGVQKRLTEKLYREELNWAFRA
ncbi:MAG: hypothetical protein Q9192_004271 [Flavoplaca navasiana]